MKNKINQIPLVYKSRDDLKTVINLCKNLDYEILHGLDDIDSIKEHIIAIVVDTANKKVFQSNVTCMAAWCNGIRKPLYAHEFINNYQKLLVEKDLNLYTSLIEKASKEVNRPGGVLLKPNQKVDLVDLIEFLRL